MFRHSFASSRVALLALAAGVTPAYSAQFYVDGTLGRDQATCYTAPGPGAAACRTIMFLVNGVNLRGGDTVNIAAGTYRERLVLDSSAPNDDQGTDANARLIFRGAGPATVISGLSPTTLDDASATACTAAADCDGNGASDLAFPNVYRFSGVPTTACGSGGICEVFETAWSIPKICVDDRPQGSVALSSTGACNGSRGSSPTTDYTNAVFEFTEPVPYTNVNRNGAQDRPTALSSLQNLSGAWWRDGSALYVHTWNGAAPSSASHDVEYAVANTLVEINGSPTAQRAWINVENLTIAYARTLFYAEYADHITVRDVVAHSASSGAIVTTLSSDYFSLLSSDVSHVFERDYRTYMDAAVTAACDKNCGWYRYGNGNVISIARNGEPPSTGASFEGVTAHRGWNAVSIQGHSNSTFRDIYAHSAPNHAFIIGTEGGIGCENIVLEGVIANNSQDGIYLFGCQGVTMRRNATNLTITTQERVPSGLRWHSNLTGFRSQAYDTIGVCSTCNAGWAADHNWYGSNATSCSWSGTDYNCRDDGIGTDWPEACNCDRNQLATAVSVALAGVSWPVDNGLAASRLTRADFLPVAGSPLIDRGNPDIDGDGVLETGPGGDDECTAAHHCAGAAPDIGPFEYGLDVASGGELPGSPPNVRRIDRR